MDEHRDMTERRGTDEALRLIVEGTAAAVGENFFPSLVRHLALALGAKYAMVTRLLEGPIRQVRTLAFWTGGGFAGNRDIPLDGMPCEKVLAGDSIFHPHDLPRLFPRCRGLCAGSQSYLGIPLVGSQGKIIGHLAVLDDEPMDEDDRRREKVLRIFGARAGAELDRAMAEEALRASEDQLRQSQKMEAIGQLAGGIAHDFNNLLTAIAGYSEFLLKSLSPKDRRRADVEEIRNAGNRAASLTRQLLAFSRRQVLHLRVLDLNEVMRDMQNLLDRVIGEDIELTTALDRALGHVKADKGQLEQVLLNLAVNARDAMPRGGRLTFETSNVDVKEPMASRLGTLRAGAYVRLAVADTGCGMGPEVREHLFEPFFTTKPKDKGTGLGLATVWGIITQSGGHIAVDSEAGHGTAFTIYLPRVSEPMESHGPALARAESPRGCETVLVVEDDRMVQEPARRVLKENGYRVLAAKSADEASRLLRRHSNAIEILVTDIVLPGINGLELAQRAKSLCPNLCVLHMSGYTDHSLLQGRMRELIGHFLQKPFAPSELARKVREVLDSRKPQIMRLEPDFRPGPASPWRAGRSAAAASPGTRRRSQAGRGVVSPRRCSRTCR